MATCVRCKKEIDSSLKYCPHCGAKQNIYIDINQVVTKSLIDGKFDAKRDIQKAPRVEIIIDDSNAATPVFVKEEKKEINRIEDLPKPNVKEADISEYQDDIDIVLPEDISERMNNVTIKEINTIEEDKYPNYINESRDVIKSKKINIFNLIYNLITNIGCLFLVGFVYFYQTNNMLIINIIKMVKNKMENIVHLSYEEYASIFGVLSLLISLIFLIVYIIKIFINIKKRYKYISNNYYYGLSMAFVLSTLYFNSLMGNFKIYQFNYFFRIHSYLIIAIIVISFIVNWICRCADPFTLAFRWGFNRYYLENKEDLPKLKGMNKSISRRKVAYLLIISIFLFSIYLEYLLSLYVLEAKASSTINYDINLSVYSNYLSRYVAYKARFDGTFNIFKYIAPVAELFYINGYGTYNIMLFTFVSVLILCIFAQEFVSKKKEKIISKFSSFIYILSLITFMILMLRSSFVLLSILDGAGVNEGVWDIVKKSIIAQIVAYIICFVVMILDRSLNKNIIRKQMTIYKEN